MRLKPRINKIYKAIIAVAIAAMATLLLPTHGLIADDESPVLYVFPFSKVAVDYPTDHLHYP
ncbi:MAG: hypothetical protein WCI32_08975, partial [Actinomycetota bacterium]